MSVTPRHPGRPVMRDIMTESIRRQLRQLHADGDNARLQQRAARLVEVATAALNAAAALRSAAAGGDAAETDTAARCIGQIDHHRAKIGWRDV